MDFQKIDYASINFPELGVRRPTEHIIQRKPDIVVLFVSCNVLGSPSPCEKSRHEIIKKYDEDKYYPNFYCDKCSDVGKE